MADRPATAPKESHKKDRKEDPDDLTVNKIILILYNFANAVLWGAILGRVILLYTLRGQFKVYWGTGELVKWTQTLALMEVMFSITGVVRAPLFTTAMQVASRLLLVWGVVEPFSNFTAHQLAYSTMLLAWSVTEVIRYSFFAISLSTGEVPEFLQWLRYNTFFILYPLGISSECWLILSVVGEAYKSIPVLGYFYMAVLVIYVPGAYILYTHMMAQRRKVMKGKTKAA